MRLSRDTIKSLLKDAIKAGISEIDVYYLMSYLTGKPKEKIFLDLDKKISPIQKLKWKWLINKRQKGIPANYITGFREFYSLNFKVNHKVLIPRPETELIIDEVLKMKPSSILDLGTGSGNIAITVKYNLPECDVTAVDISRSALRVARYNCKAILGKLKINFQRSDFCNNINGEFDLIVSNPPYIPDDTLKKLQREVSVYEPKIALSGGMDGLNSYKKIFSGCRRCLKANGRLILELSDEILNGVKRLSHMYKWSIERIIKDYSGISRIAIFKLH